MRNFRTAHNFVVTEGKNYKTKGAFCSIEYAERCVESGLVNSKYTIWQRINGKWRAIRERIVSR